MAELNLFQTDRTSRQKYCIKTWIKSKLHSTIEAATGFGKTRVALMSIKLLKKHLPNIRCIIVVPTETLKEQWEQHLTENDLIFNCEVHIINSLIKNKWKCDLLVIDEIHRMAADTFSQIFKCVTYKYILGLTATLSRLDGKDAIVRKYCPVSDTVSIEECLLNHWVSEYKEYLVLLDVDNIEEYKEYNKQFTKAFEFFNYNFDLAMSCLGSDGFKKRIELAKQLSSTDVERKELLKVITLNAMQFIRSIQKRKAFINNHPKKIQVAQKILSYYKDRKVITFSNNVKMAEALENGKNVYTGKTSKKKSRVLIEDFNKLSTGTLNTCMKANEGLDVDGLSVAIILGLDSSPIKATQRRGRVIRWAPDKTAYIFNLVIKNTVEVEWFYKSHRDGNYTVIDERGLDKVLNGEKPEPYQGNINRFTFRF